MIGMLHENICGRVACRGRDVTVVQLSVNELTYNLENKLNERKGRGQSTTGAFSACNVVRGGRHGGSLQRERPSRQVADLGGWKQIAD